MNHPVFGSLTRDSLTHAWIGEVKLPTLAGCYVRWIPNVECPDERDEKRKRGIFDLNILCRRGREPSPEQVAAYTYLLDNETKVTDSLMTGILRHFHELWFEDWEAEWKDKRLVQSIDTVTGIRETVSFLVLYVHAEAKEGQSYIGFDFGCDWHPHLSEHNLGVLMHRERVVATGQAETAFEFQGEILE